MDDRKKAVSSSLFCVKNCIYGYNIGGLFENTKIPSVCSGVFVFYWVYLRIPTNFPNNFSSFFKIVGEYSYM